MMSASEKSGGYHLAADCENCFGLCCAALPYAKSADFAFNKDRGIPCRHLQADNRCGIHHDLRNKGFRGCTVYECFGAGQRVSRNIYQGKDWRDNPQLAREMFDVFHVMQQIHEMLYYLAEAMSLEATQDLTPALGHMYKKTEGIACLAPKALLALDLPIHRAKVNELLLKTSELVRLGYTPKTKLKKSGYLIGAKLRGADLRGANLRGAFLIAADLSKADLRCSDFIGADMRDTNLRGANLTGSIFLTQAQINSANGNMQTKIPAHLKVPDHWKG